MIRAKNYETVSKFVKVMQRKLLASFFSGHGVAYCMRFMQTTTKMGHQNERIENTGLENAKKRKVPGIYGTQHCNKYYFKGIACIYFTRSTNGIYSNNFAGAERVSCASSLIC